MSAAPNLPLFRKPGELKQFPPPRQRWKRVAGWILAAMVVGVPVFAHWCRTFEVPLPGLWIFAGTLCMLGIETIFTAFLVGILELPRESERAG